MKIFKAIAVIAVISTATFLYVRQSVEAVILSYEINENQLRFNMLLDQRKELEYNVAKLKAPTYLEFQLAKKEATFVLPERWQVFEAAVPTAKKPGLPLPQFVRNIVGLFSLKSEAQATPATDRLAKKPY